MEHSIIEVDELKTPIGPLTFMFSGKELVRVDFGTLETLKEKALRYFKKTNKDVRFVQQNKDHVLKEELEAYFQGTKREFSGNYSFYGTDFQKAVWHALLEIPYGTTVTYKDIATKISRPKAARAVGGAVNKNPFSIVVPCHRVIGANGDLVGYGGGLDRKKYLLELEQDFIKS